MLPKYLAIKKNDYNFKFLKKVDWILTNKELIVECGDGYLNLSNFIGDKNKNALFNFGGYIDDKIIVKVCKKDIKKNQELVLYQKNGDKIVSQSEVFIFN